jgi:mono/diheme cytochrome c family protein
MTSMPAYGPTFSDEKIWAITAFVTHKLPKMSAAEYSEWVKYFTAPPVPVDTALAVK